MLWFAFSWEVEEGSIVVHDWETWIVGLEYAPYLILVIVVQVSQVKAGTSALQTPPTFTLKLEHA